LQGAEAWRWRRTRGDLLVEFMTPSFEEDEGARRIDPTISPRPMKTPLLAGRVGGKGSPLLFSAWPLRRRTASRLAPN